MRGRARALAGLLGTSALLAGGLAASASAATFSADPGSLGAIPDGDPGGATRDVTFPVAGLSGAPTDVAVTMTGLHGFIGDVEAVLIAPDATQQSLFSRPDVTGPMQSGDSSNFAGPYTFSDAAPTAPTFWDAAAAIDGASFIPAGAYRASGPNSGANLLITPAFAGLANPNGTWTLRVRDFVAGTSGSISDASLTVMAAAPPAPSLTATDPVSPSGSNNPRIRGSATAGTQVRLYATADCSGTPLASGTAAELAGAGIPITVADNSTTQIRATATNVDAQVSACSAPIAYVESSPGPEPPPGPVDPDPIPPVVLTDTTPPKTRIGRKPKWAGRDHSHFGFASSEPGSRFRCSLDGARFRACRAPVNYRNLKPGRHVFRVFAIDAAGNADPTPARVRFRVKG